MDANIKTAATLLRNSSIQMQSRIRALQAEEHKLRNDAYDKERHIRSDLLDTSRKMAASNDTTGKSSFLVKHAYDLYRQSNQIKAEADKKVSADEQEIHTLRDQSDKLNQLAHTLDMWQ